MQVNRKRIVVNTFLLYGKTLTTMILSFISTRLILDGLGALDFGIYGTVGGAILMLESLNGAMTQATQRYMNYAEGKGEKESLLFVFNNTVILHIIIGLILVVLMGILYFPLFDGIFNIPEPRIEAAKYIYMFLIASTFFTIITVPYDAMINAHEDFLYYSIVGIVIALLKLGAALVVLYYFNDRLILYGLLMASIAIANMSIMRMYCRIKYEECRFHPRKFFKMEMVKEIGTFASWNFVGAFANISGNHGSTILMNHFFGPILIAAKNIGDQICTQVSVLTTNMTKALNPVIVKSEGGGDRHTMIQLSYVSCRFSYLLYLVLAIPFIYNTEDLLAIWLNEIPAWAVLFCQWQVLRTLFEQLFGPLRLSLMAEGSVKEINAADLLLGILNFFILWGLYQYGFSAEWHYYISIILLVFVAGFIKIYLCVEKCNISLNDYLREVIQPCFISTIAATAVAYLLQQLDGAILIIASIQVFSIFVVEGLLGLTNHERRVIVSMITSYINKR